MKKHHSIFLKVTGIIAFLVIPIVILHFYSFQTSVSTIRDEVMNNRKTQLSFLKDQIESSVERFSLIPGTLAQDSSVVLLQSSMYLDDPYLTTKAQKQLEEKMDLQKFSNTWESDISMYFLELDRVISTSNQVKKKEVFETDSYGEWQYYKDGHASYFRLLYTEPFLIRNTPENANVIFEIRFDVRNIQNLLNQNQIGGQRNLFLYTNSGQYIGTQNESKENNKIIKGISISKKKPYHQFEVTHDGENLLVSYFYIPMLNAYLVDYVPIEKIILPISKSRTLFICSLSVLLLLAIISLLFLYRNVQQPIQQLINGLAKFEIGSYSFRIHKKYNNEFDYVVSRFNQMGSKIQHLIENIYEEKSRSRLASIKQLQSQINPHFLYNCLAFISSSTKVGANDSVEKMTHHLADYFRYTTDVENQCPTLKEEIELIQHYLEIYKMRLERIEFEIDIPNDMLDEEFLRLTLQPIVENAIIHGIEPKVGKGFIRIKGFRKGSTNMLVVDDNGGGVIDEKLEHLQKNIDKPQSKEIRVGIHNVHQRLKYHFGEGSGVFFSHSKHGGLRVELRWNRKTEQ